MNRNKKARVILEAIDKYAPTQINWNMAKLWLNAIARGLNDIAQAEEKEDRPRKGMTLEEFVGKMDGTGTFSIYLHGEPLTFDQRYDYMILDPEEWEEKKEMYRNKYQPSCMSMQDWWPEAKDHEIESWDAIERAYDNMLIRIWMK
ncbi:hypothetical protein [Clostridium sp. AM33-3]|uniref:hypothetical protein n=1 Tax=Clostridium sp. AM33-3 TaxID=2292304 RepID=UPI000E473F3F|nr:hypothetical protein [Clostridium sp. AM33-3]RHT20968.1 hypothetical protein DW819_08565 [Clostridium sp. AM33-3]